ncbi:MAG: transposase [Akkermansiaceae bacterium]
MPRALIQKWKEQLADWSAHHPKPWNPEVEQEYHQRFTQQLELWLDEGHGSCLIKDPSARKILEDTLMRDQGLKADHHCWVLMPNHAHLLFTPHAPIDKLMQSWKGVSARRIGKGSIWQKNYRDTLIRDSSHFTNAVRYIRRNPAKLREGTFTLWQSERAKAV